MKPVAKVMGVEALRRNFAALGKETKKIGRAAIKQSAKIIAAAEAAAAPRRTGALAKAIGSRGMKSKEAGDVLAAKAGIDVGKTGINGKVVNRGKGFGLGGAPHGHLVALGTANRWTKQAGKGLLKRIKRLFSRLGFRGRTTANPFARLAAIAATPAAVETLRLALTKGINRAWARRNKSKN